MERSGTMTTISKEYILEGFNTLQNSNRVFAPHEIKGLVFANMKTADGLKETDKLTCLGILKWNELMLTHLTETPMSDEFFISDEAYEAIDKVKITAQDFYNLFGNCFKVISGSIDELNTFELVQLRNDKVIEGFSTAMYANFEIVVKTCKGEEV